MLVRSFLALSTLTLVDSQPNNAPGKALVASMWCEVLSPARNWPILLQTGMVASMRWLRVVPRLLAVESTCAPKERAS